LKVAVDALFCRGEGIDSFSEKNYGGRVGGAAFKKATIPHDYLKYNIGQWQMQRYILKFLSIRYRPRVLAGNAGVFAGTVFEKAPIFLIKDLPKHLDK